MLGFCLSSAHTSFVLVTLSLCLTACSASIAPNWTNPNAHLSSFSSTYINGERIIVSWNPLNLSTNDLWLTRYDHSVDDFSLRLATTIDISVPGSYPWTIAVSNQEIELDTRFEFVFIPSGANYNASAPTNLESPPFNLVLVNQVAPPNGTVGAAAPSTAVASATVTAPASATTGLNSDSTVPSDYGGSSGSSLSYAAEAGIAVAAIAVIFLIGLAFGFCVFKKKKSRKSQSIINEIKMEGPYETLASTKQPTELSSKEAAVHEMSSSRRSSILESAGTPLSELPATFKRTSVYEMP